MFNMSEDIQSLSHFKRNTPIVVKQLKKTRRPMVLTIDGKAEIVVQDATEYQALLECKDQLAWLKLLAVSIEQDDKNQVKSARSVLEAMRKKYAL